MSVTKDLLQLEENLKSSKRFILLKDLPGCKAGTIFQQWDGDKMFIVPELINLQGGVIWNHLKFNLYSVEDNYGDFFKPFSKKDLLKSTEREIDYMEGNRG